ncbi:hypothetical protein A0H81_08482 [Grifola frondosa]|uniref:Cytochrome P450 n=1 Tax=Grifola frondosa TaxID=5627 RepID=A0A1C7M2Q5_GRIFR|nr:hypothetical protein A0H81_08482 [Grifola frondosa]
MTIPIPSPPAIPFIGHVTSLEKEVPIRSINLLAQQYGGIFQLNIIGQKRIFLSCYEFVNEVSDEKRFSKKVSAALKEVRNATGDGLFTAHVPGEQNWYIAHRLLMPAFSTMTVHGMFDDMTDVVSQLLLKWERFGPRCVIDPAADFTRLTLDAICLCAMSYRLNSFYREQPHPFAQAMGDFLVESGLRANRASLVQALMTGTNAKYEEDQRILNELVTEILEDHRAHPPEKKDVLSTMLDGRDAETGMKLSDECMKYNLVTFLIAGHETTSGMLTFTVYYLLKNPEAMRKLREEIDTRIGNRPMSVHDVNKLPYLIAVMRESLRLSPTAPARTVTPIEDTTLGGKYAVQKDDIIVLNMIGAQRDPKVWGDDADQFKPERMLDAKFEALPPNAWQPFGFGTRACIGRPFAWQEAQIALVSVLQKFDLTLEDPSYELALKQTLTIKPNNFFIHAIPRAGKPRLLAVPSSTLLQSEGGAPAGAAKAVVVDDGTPKQSLYVLYGSNTGSSEAFAQRIATDASSYGFRASIGTLDSATARVPTDGPVVIITASFEGQPADNAAHFVEWLSNLDGSELSGVKYAVFGCGNRDWVQTYQRIPTLCDDLLAQRGGTRLLARGEGDAAVGEFFEAFDNWEDSLWEHLRKEYNTTANASASTGVEVKTVTSGTARAEVLRQRDTALGTVVVNSVLTAPGAPIKRHLGFELPEQTTFRAGDYLAILPTNPARDVHRAIARFGLSAEEEVTLTSAGPTSLPVNKPISLFNLLSGYVELSQPATTRDLDILLKAADSEGSTKALNELSAAYTEKIFRKRLSVLDLLEEYADVKMSLGAFLQMLPAMRIRQYSISSSPLSNPQRVTLTISVLDAPSISGRQEPFLGVASTYLAGLRPGDKVQLAVRASNAAFHPPTDPSIPLVMICAGAGLAPMRGFLQERAMQKQAGREVAKSLLFFGCRSPKEDYLYGDTDLKEWAELGIADVRPAFSRSTEDSEGCRHVQDRLWHDRADLIKAHKQDCKFFVCGASTMAVGVKGTLINIIKEYSHVDDTQAAAEFSRIMNGRYAIDVFE